MARTKYGNVKTQVTEKQEQAAIIQLIESIGGKVYKLGGARKRGDFPGTMQTPGLPDLFAFLPPTPLIVHNAGSFLPGAGRHVAVWIEVKRLGGKMRKAQGEFAVSCLCANIHHICGTSDDAIKWLKIGGWLK